MPEVDNSGSPSLSPPCYRPTQFPEPSASWNDLPCGRRVQEFELKGAVLVFGQEVNDLRREGPCLHDDHARSMRQ